jgi:GNAT superfamily N-acetyltransferase
MHFERVSSEKYVIEKEVLNSDSFYNLLAYDKNELTDIEINEEKESTSSLGAERYFLKEGENYVGIIEYLLNLPNDNSTWLGLLLVKKEFQGKGLGKLAFELFSSKMRTQGINKFRLCVFKDYKSALHFWNKQDLIYLTESVNENKRPVIVFEKIL